MLLHCLGLHGLVAFYNIQAEMEQVYSYNHGAHIGPRLSKYLGLRMTCWRSSSTNGDYGKI